MKILDVIPRNVLIKLELAQGFYNIRPHPEINATYQLHLDEEDGYLGVDASDKLAMHLFLHRLSVVMFYADKRGVTMEYWSPIGGSNFTLHVQWKELGIRTKYISQSLVEDYLPQIKNKIFTTFIEFIITRGSKAKKAIFQAIRSIDTEERMWRINDDFTIIQENDLYHLYCGRQLRRSHLRLEGLTRNLLT